MAEQEKIMMNAENEAKWKENSKGMITSLFLTNPITEEPMGLVSDLVEISEDTFAFYAADKIDSEQAIQYVVQITEVIRGEAPEDGDVDDESSIVADPNAGKLLDADGNPLA